MINLCGFQKHDGRVITRNLRQRTISVPETNLNYTCTEGSECCVLVMLSNWDNGLNRGNLTILPSHQTIRIGVKDGTRQRGCLLHFTELLVMPIVHDIINLLAGYLQLYLIQ